LANRSARIPLALVAALGGVTGYFVLVTIAMDTVPDAALVGLACVVAFAIALGLLGGGRGISEALKADRRLLVIAGLGGALAFWAAPMLALSQRATDAPSGADSLFFTTSVWALVCVAGAFAVRAERPLATALAGAVGAVAGAAGTAGGVSTITVEFKKFGVSLDVVPTIIDAKPFVLPSALKARTRSITAGSARTNPRRTPGATIFEKVPSRTTRPSRSSA
jgi:hypothetical protein